jgi:murein DD-endopeptidase MepM/ murein hydrolase activator NlpD
VGADILLSREGQRIEARVPPRATLASLLRAHDLPSEIVEAIVSSAREVFDPRRLRADRRYRLERTLDGVLRWFEYDLDGDRFLRIVRIVGDGLQPIFAAELIPVEKTRTLAAFEGVIDAQHSSLVSVIEAQGERIDLAIAFAEIFAGDVDFSNDLQRGDRFRIFAEKLFYEGEFAGYGDILAATMENDGRTLNAFRFTQPGGRPDYYDEQGRSLRRVFLRSPLRFEPRVTSRFSRSRLHPVLGVRRAHLGVDYGAPYGAPVIAVASGVVVSAGWSGGAGRMVTLRHSGGYESSYLHLSSIAVSRGARVAQGEVIGRVGSSGLSTGPHLDYRLRKNGVFVNPLEEHRRMPPGEPIAPAYLNAFHAQRDRALGRLASARPVDGGPVRVAAAAAQPDLQITAALQSGSRQP